MPQHYSPSHFLQQMPIPLLREFFSNREQLLELEWDDLKPGDVQPIYKAWQTLPDLQRAEVENVFRSVWALATKEGLITIIEEARFHGLDLTKSFEGLSGLHEKVLWTYLNQTKVFGSAGRLDQADRLNARYWRLRNDLPVKKPDISHLTRELLTHEISQYFQEKQGRGQNCTLEVYLRRETLHYFFCYPSDYADTALVYEIDGTLGRHVQKSAFFVIFAYNETNGSLDVFVQGNKVLRQDMEEIFCRLILKEKLPAPGPRHPYDLSLLRTAQIEFPTDPSDNIIRTRVKTIRLSVAFPGTGRITFEGDDRRLRGNVYDLMKTFLNREQLATSDVSVNQVVLEVTFKTDGKDKKVQFAITHPDSCTLRDDPEHLIIKDYLRRWGIAEDRSQDEAFRASR
jgi:hypothetical protein